MKKIIFMSSIAFMFIACEKNMDVPQIQPPQKNQSLSDYLNKHEVNKYFVYNAMGHYSKIPFQTLYSTNNNEVLYRQLSVYLTEQKLDFYHHLYRYCEAIGGNNIIKKDLLLTLMNYDKVPFGSEEGQVMEFINLRDKYSYHEVPNGYYECQAGDNSYEVVRQNLNYSYIEYGPDTCNGENSGLYLVKYQKPQNASFIDTNEFKGREIKNLGTFKFENNKYQAINDKHFTRRPLVIYEQCVSNGGTPYIIGEATEYQKIHLGEYFVKDLMYGKGSVDSLRKDYTIYCDSKTDPYTFKKTFDNDLRQYINQRKKLGSYTSNSANYEIIYNTNELKNYKPYPLEKAPHILKLVNTTTGIVGKQKSSLNTLYNDYYSYRLITNKKGDGYVSVVQKNKNDEITTILTYSLSSSGNNFLGKANQQEINKAKQVIENNAEAILNKCSLKLKDFKIGQYTLNCYDSVIYAMQNNKIHYILNTQN